MDLGPSPRNGNPLQQLYGSRRSLRWIVFLVLAALAVIYMTGSSYQPYGAASSGDSSSGSTGHKSSTSGFKHPHKKQAKNLSPVDLMKRPISRDLQSMPKLMHQSWSSTELPAKFERWSSMCKQQHPDWEWVLWTDEDNEELVRTHFPWLLKTYLGLPSVIYRADLVRNLYMYMFGGVYADLDIECLQPIDQLFAEYNVTTVSHGKPRPQSTQNMQKSGRKAFFGRMGTDTGSSNSIPNAWMASTPGHPFFLIVLESVMKRMSEEGGDMENVEGITGPGKLYDMINEYTQPESKWAGEALDKHVAKNPTAKQFNPRKGLKHSIEVLPFQYIYPYSWERDGEAFRDVCWATKETFNSERCKLLLATDRWPSYTVTYWSHTWTSGGHDDGNVQKLEMSDQ
ncbi:uncharacterized protein Z519_00196 [Cladophialophora bantiana CBS 173.52]|uniref:Uncharacterized protein n=1 Tax=Cladophialophora bantiana (strain ATCC 10958 / CBS 173.52 / CDC B-1940 / NIH 8579) TaxID=1442370 RepID=A0A0D2I5M6_CLAB1|nr:uncharacterized protein Z519_00196 [Cladophialophora bantiana CBS 173.52]KIW98535.1 hypothetical protein Z519_00196 [Cladophialophora bantiana CBS 173.52]